MERLIIEEESRRPAKAERLRIEREEYESLN